MLRVTCAAVQPVYSRPFTRSTMSGMRSHLDGEASRHEARVCDVVARDQVVDESKVAIQTLPEDECRDRHRGCYRTQARERVGITGHGGGEIRANLHQGGE